MKKLITLIMIIGLLVSANVSYGWGCGDPGPQGEQGPQGEEYQ